MTRLHGRTTLAALALLVLGCSVGAAHTAFARPHSLNATAHIHRSIYHGIAFYDRLDSLIYADVEQAFIRLDIPALPTGSVVDHAWMSYHQTQGSSPYPRTGLVHIGYDPLTYDDGSLWNTIRYGLPISDTTTNAGQVWVRRALNASGIFMLQNSLTQGRTWFAVGIHSMSGAGRASGYAPDSTYSPVMEIEYTLPGDPDVAVLGARIASYPLVSDDTDTIEATLVYLGTGTAAPFYMHLRHNFVFPDSVLVESLVQGETTLVLMPLHNAAGSSGLTNICCYSADTADVQRRNDSVWLQDWTFPVGTYAAEGFNSIDFPPLGWDTLWDGGSGYWQPCAAKDEGSGRLPSDDYYAHSGTGAAKCNRDSGGANDDWLVSPALTPTPDHSDSGFFYYRGGMTGDVGDSIEVWAMHGHARSDTLRTIAGVHPQSMAYQILRFALDDFDGDTINIGIRNRSSGSDPFVLVDDVYFLRHPSGGVDAPTDASLPASFSVIPNPARSGEAVSIRCPAGEPARLSIHDALGRSVWSATVPRTQALSTMSLVLPRLAAGIYLVRLESGFETATAKLVLRP